MTLSIFSPEAEDLTRTTVHRWKTKRKLPRLEKSPPVSFRSDSRLCFQLVCATVPDGLDQRVHISNGEREA